MPKIEYFNNPPSSQEEPAKKLELEKLRRKAASQSQFQTENGIVANIDTTINSINTTSFSQTSFDSEFGDEQKYQNLKYEISYLGNKDASQVIELKHSKPQEIQAQFQTENGIIANVDTTINNINTTSFSQTSFNNGFGKEQKYQNLKYEISDLGHKAGNYLVINNLETESILSLYSKFNEKLSSVSIPSRLPAEFQEVEYIKSTGTQWIDTNFNPNQDTRVVINYQDDDITVSTHGFIGARDNVNNGFLIGGRSTYYWYAQYGNEQTPGTIFRNDNLRHFVDLNKTLLYYDNSLIHTFSSQVFSNQKSLTLFITNDFGSTNNAIGKIFQCQIYNNNILVRNFVPCYRKSDNEIGLYDLVNNIFYPNSGTGTFIKGPDV